MHTAIKYLVAGATLSIAMTSFAARYSNRASAEHLRQVSMDKYSLCDVSAMARTLVSGMKDQKDAARTFDVRFVQDHRAGYNYYMATTHTFNADAVRGAVCHYINKHQCYLYWGNVMNVAMIADRPAPRFPLDASPHYMLSPMITCNKVN